MIFRPLAAAVLCFLAGCDDAALTLVCPSEPPPALEVSVVDGEGGRSLAGEARGWYAVGTRSDSLRYYATPSGDGLFAAGPAGTYRVEVLVDGRAPWVREAVQVHGGACGPVTVRLLATPPPPG